MPERRRQPIISVLGHVDAGKCVAPDTRIQLANGSTERAEDIFRKWKKRGELKETEEGEVYELEKGPETFGLSGNEIQRCEITHLWKLQKDRLFNFSLRDGSSIKATPEHPFLIVEGGEFKFKEAIELKEGDFVAIPEKVPVKELTIDEVKSEVLKKLGEDEHMLAFLESDFAEELYENGKDIRNELLTNHLYSCKEDLRYRIKDVVRICKNSEISLDRAYDRIEKVKQGTLKWRAGKTSKKVSLPRNIEEFKELAYATGLLLGDGNAEASKLSNNSEEIREEFRGALETSLSIHTEVKLEDQRVDRVEISCGKTFWRLLHCLFDYPREKKSHRIRLSKFTLKLPKAILSNLISGYFDADGYVNKRGEVKVTSASEEMVTSLKTALKRFGIHPKLTEKEGFHKLVVSGRYSLQNFKEIGFRKDDKKRRFKIGLKNASTNSLTDLVPVTGQEIRKARMELGASHTEIDVSFQKKYEGYENISKSYLKKFTRACRDLQGKDSFRDNIREKRTILDSLKDSGKSREEIYSQSTISHPRLMNHLKSLSSENLIQAKSNPGFIITDNGLKQLEDWEEKPEIIGKLSQVAESDLRFVKVEDIEEENGGTVYDFTTELETFIAEDLVVHNTTILDRIRETKVATEESGGITQHIGATEISLDVIKNLCGHLLPAGKIRVPGLLFIDTPGHEAFTTLRKRGGSVSDLAILVVDVNEGFEPQTDESLQFLKNFSTPFVVAATKIDRLKGWNSNEGACFSETYQKQREKVRDRMDEKIYEIIGDLSERGFTADRFDRVDDFKNKIGVVPVSGETGEGTPDLLSVLVGLSQKFLEEELELKSEEGRGTVLEVKETKGLGTTIDVILYEGEIRKNDRLVVGGEDPVITKVKALLKPRELKELRTERKFERVQEVRAASGIKVSAPDLEDVVAGSPLRSLRPREDVEKAKEELEEAAADVEIKSEGEGITLKADTLGSLEGLINMLEDKDIPVKKAAIGDVTRKDIMEESSVEDPLKRAIFAFNVDVTETASRCEEDVKVFKSSVIYEILEEYEEWKEQKREEIRKRKLEEVTRPGKIKLLPGYVFRQRKPAVVGCEVVGGVIKSGYDLVKGGKRVGRIQEIQDEGVTIDEAKTGDKVAVSISKVTVGRQVEEGDVLYSLLSDKDIRKLEELQEFLSEDEKRVLEEVKEEKFG